MAVLYKRRYISVSSGASPVVFMAEHRQVISGISKSNQNIVVQVLTFDMLSIASKFRTY